MLNKNNLPLMGYPIFCGSLNDINFLSPQKKIVNTLNSHSYIVAKDDSQFQQALLESDLLLPDGSGIVLAAKVIKSQSITKIAGADLHRHLLEKINKIGGKVFYLGASDNTLHKISEKIKTEFPNIKMQCFSPPYKESFTQQENQEMQTAINEFSPDALFVGMTAPKQEKWLHENSSNLNFKVASSIGAVFDFYAGTVKRPSQFWINLHLEWLIRLISEPKRLWKRNFVSSSLFLRDVFLLKNKDL